MSWNSSISQWWTFSPSWKYTSGTAPASSHERSALLMSPRCSAPRTRLGRGEGRLQGLVQADRGCPVGPGPQARVLVEVRLDHGPLLHDVVGRPFAAGSLAPPLFTGQARRLVLSSSPNRAWACASAASSFELAAGSRPGADQAVHGFEGGRDPRFQLAHRRLDVHGRELLFQLGEDALEPGHRTAQQRDGVPREELSSRRLASTRRTVPSRRAADAPAGSASRRNRSKA